jgi:pimeloyl-ACP methyl ester carboxylesterase
MKPSSIAKGAAIAGAAGAVAASAWAIERAVSRRRGRGEGDATVSADVVLQPITLAKASIPTHDGGTINYIDTGTKGVLDGTPTIVLVHGVTLSVRTWVRQLDALPRAGLRVVAYDQRGHGESVLGDTGFSVPNLGDDLAKLLEGLGLDDVVLVGHSMGGIAVQSFVARHPEMARRRVRGIMLLSTLAATLGGSQATQLNALIEKITRRTPDSTPFWGIRAIGTRLARVGFGQAPEENHLELVRQMLHECAPSTRAAGPRSLIGFDLTEELDRIDVPTIIVCGTKDVITPPSNSRLMHERIAGSRLELLEGGGHMLMLERTDTVNALIEEVARSPRRELVA